MNNQFISPLHSGPAGPRVRFDQSIHGFAPVATACRPFGTNVLTLGQSVGDPFE